MPPHDPALLNTENRTREVAQILARGLARLRRPSSSPGPATPAPGEKVSENSRNELAVTPEPSVTVHAD
jgi:hypothetical protein